MRRITEGKNCVDAAVVAKKLLLKPGTRARIVNAPEGYVESFEHSAADVRALDEGESDLEFVQLFVKDRAQLDELAPTAMRMLRHGSLLWVCYPKGSSRVRSDLNRDLLWAAMRERGYEGVTLISVDDTWSAMRFRPAAQVRT